MQRILLFLLCAIIFSQTALGRDKSIMDNKATIYKDKHYKEKLVYAADPRLVIPPVLAKTLFEDMHSKDRSLFARAFSQKPDIASKVVAAQLALYCWQKERV